MSPSRTVNSGAGPAQTIDPLVVLLLGPTGSGKTALSLALAERFHGEIVSCDSVAVYRGMDLGTAKPTPAERARIPHHLIDVADPDEPFTAGDYSRSARAALREIAGRGRLPIVTGGTGLYLRAFTEGLFAGPARQEDLRKRLRRSAERHGSAWLHRLLTRLDPASAERIHANDTPKLIRAIEVCLAARQPMSQVLARDPLTGFRLLRIGLNPPRAALYERLNQRCAEMFAATVSSQKRAPSSPATVPSKPSTLSATARPCRFSSRASAKKWPLLKPSRAIATTPSASSPGSAASQTSTGLRLSETSPKRSAVPPIWCRRIDKVHPPSNQRQALN